MCTPTLSPPVAVDISGYFHKSCGTSTETTLSRLTLAYSSATVCLNKALNSLARLQTPKAFQSEQQNLAQLVTEFCFRNDLFTHFLPQSC